MLLSGPPLTTANTSGKNSLYAVGRIRTYARRAELTSVAGLIQVTHKKPLDILKAFCRKEIDLLSVSNIPSLQLVQEQMPPFWNILHSIIKLEESSQYLPKDVAAITLKLLEIRYLTFRRATQRDSSLYREWTSEKSHPCIFCPGFKMTKCPCKYIVSGRKDKDFCSKQFPENRIFSYGVNSGGCCCPLNITYFFELMLERESPENIFRFLTCHDVQLNPDLPGKLDGIIHDFACGLDEYLLNREAKQFQYLRVLAVTEEAKETK